MVFGPVDPPLFIVVQLILRPGKYPSGFVGIQLIPPTWMEFSAKSLKKTPRSVPVMMMVVPPLGGPNLGLKSLIVGLGHSEPVVARFCEGQSPVNEQVSLDLSHQPHSNPLVMLVPIHEEQPVANAGQL
jgi:hypothetical protein